MCPDPSRAKNVGLAPGALLSHYRIVDCIGAGGMGVVYHAVDTRLNRPVALKLISQVDDEGRRLRFVKEARAAAAVNHPNIVTIYEVDADGGVDFIAMELLSGQPLDRCVPPGGLPLGEVIAYAEQIALALETAHAAGIVHRDIKPANVMVSGAGQVKVLDFGVAKLLATEAPDASTMTVVDATRQGMIIGSPAYMSPEQAEGGLVDTKTDIFSFGLVLHEMLTGKRPSGLAPGPPSASALSENAPPAALVALTIDCLDRGRDRRPSAGDCRRRLAAIREEMAPSAPGLRALFRHPGIVATIATCAAAVLGGGIYWWASGREVRAAQARMPEIRALAEKDDRDGFYRAARGVVPLLPDDLHLRNLWINLTMTATFDSAPSGADVWVKGYAATAAEWIPIGRTPIKDMRVPLGAGRLRLAKEGYVGVEAALNPFSAVYPLDLVAAAPEGMARIPAAPIDVLGTSLSLPDFWLDRFEVTNRQFSEFIKAGGYRRRELWKEAFVDGGSTLEWADAITRFRDTTGRPGPSTWELGTYPVEQADFPVSGVSWYEAAAYAVFVGKSLPTAFQWRSAAGLNGFSANFADILTLSNFGNKGPAAVGSHAGLGAWGASDLAGNVKEWCWNESARGRMILGGAWNEPAYMFNDVDAQSPFARLGTYGIRLVKNIEAQPASSYDLIPVRTRNYAEEKPLSDEAFAVIRGLYGYDPQPLNAKLEQVDETPDWRRETVTIDAAYNGERIIVHLYLPRARAPYQPVIFASGGDATLLRSSRVLRITEAAFVVRSGRALVYPVYKGTYERIVERPSPNTLRDNTIARGKDLRRVVDYIESRPDLDRERIGYYGLSLGAFGGVIGSAIESRIKASVLAGGGLTRAKIPPEVDPFNFAPRVRVPTLMINGRNDFTNPLVSSQLPLFQLLGLPPDRKRHTVLEGGHIPDSLHDLMREALDWFDRYLGPV